MRPRYLILLLAIAAGIIGYAIYWRALANRVEDEVHRWVAERNAEGWQVGHGGIAIDGFPGRLVVTVAEPEFAWPEDALGFAWAGEELIGHLQPWNLRHVIVDLGESHRFAWTAEGRRREAMGTAEGAIASLVFDNAGQLARAAVDVAAPSLSGGGLSEPLSAARLQLHARRDRGEQPAAPAAAILQLAMQAEQVALPPELAGPLGRDMPSLRVSVAMPEPLPRGPEALAAWRDDGGSVELERLEMTWGPLSTEGQGTLSLDREMRPLGALTVELRGFAATIDALVAAGQIRPKDAGPAKLMLGLLASRDEQGQVLRAPVSAQDGRLYLGPVALLRLRPLTELFGRNPGQEPPVPHR